MKKNIHPDYHLIKIMMTNGNKIETRSTYGKKGDILKLDIDPNTHPAWKPGSHQLIESSGQLTKFRNKFQNLKL
jgi:large subunit ribosomal protein L31